MSSVIVRDARPTPPIRPGGRQSPFSTIPGTPRAPDKAHALGLTSATGLVVGSIVGTGVFTMPAALAEAGDPSTVVQSARRRHRGRPEIR